jgi:hypothetical protein
MTDRTPCSCDAKQELVKVPYGGRLLLLTGPDVICNCLFKGLIHVKIGAAFYGGLRWEFKSCSCSSQPMMPFGAAVILGFLVWRILLHVSES